MKRWVVALTGASGMRYALTLLDLLTAHVDKIDVIVSDAALRVLQEEEDIKLSQSALSATALLGREEPKLAFHNPRDVGSEIASGSAIFEGMVVIPCSMATVGAINSGAHAHLVHRVADVTMKEGRKLILVPRETPLSPIHLRNLHELSSYGVRIVPAMPGFYSKPQTIDDLVRSMAMKVLDAMGIENSVAPRWREGKA